MALFVIPLRLWIYLYKYTCTSFSLADRGKPIREHSRTPCFNDHRANETIPSAVFFPSKDHSSEESSASWIFLPCFLIWNSEWLVFMGFPDRRAIFRGSRVGIVGLGGSIKESTVGGESEIEARFVFLVFSLSLWKRWTKRFFANFLLCIFCFLPILFKKKFRVPCSPVGVHWLFM